MPRLLDSDELDGLHREAMDRQHRVLEHVLDVVLLDDEPSEDGELRQVIDRTIVLETDSGGVRNVDIVRIVRLPSNIVMGMGEE